MRWRFFLRVYAHTVTSDPLLFSTLLLGLVGGAGTIEELIAPQSITPLGLAAYSLCCLIVGVALTLRGWRGWLRTRRARRLRRTVCQDSEWRDFLCSDEQERDWHGFVVVHREEGEATVREADPERERDARLPARQGDLREENVRYGPPFQWGNRLVRWATTSLPLVGDRGVARRFLVDAATKREITEPLDLGTHVVHPAGETGYPIFRVVDEGKPAGWIKKEVAGEPPEVPPPT